MSVGADIASLGAGSLVGFVLGLIGGGGSILAVPLLVYVVGVASPHVAIGTSAVAVALSAFANLLGMPVQAMCAGPARSSSPPPVSLARLSDRPSASASTGRSSCFCSAC